MRSIITTLRDLAPLHRLSTRAALRFAEAQAECLLRLSGIKEPPLGEEVIAGMPHIHVERVVAPPDALAATQWSPSHGRWIVLLNGATIRGRQRWSLAHEVKHILDHPFVTILYPKDSNELAEKSCEYFAGCLLVPRRWLRHAWKTGVRDPHVLAERFGVTTQAMIARLLQTGLIPPTSHHLTREV